MTNKVRFHHYHEGNDKNREIRGPALYSTEAALVHLETGDVLAVEMAHCSPRDVPQRRIGRQVALGRLLKQMGKLDWPINVDVNGAFLPPESRQ